MSNSFRTETVVACRRQHRCDYCRCDIPAGTPSVKIVGKWEGAFYTARGHLDCEAMWREVYDWFASDEGMAFDLAEVFFDAGEGQETLDHLRGFYPHVVTRIERLQQMSAIAHADSLRARGFDPVIEED